MQNNHSACQYMADFLSPAGRAEVLDCKAVWRRASHGAWRRGHCGGLRCSGTQGEGRGSGPGADLVARTGVVQLWNKREQEWVQWITSVKMVNPVERWGCSYCTFYFFYSQMQWKDQNSNNNNTQSLYDLDKLFNFTLSVGKVTKSST